MAITISQEPARSRDGVAVYFVAIENGIWFEFMADASPTIETKVIVDVYLADGTLVNTNDIVLFFGVDDKVFFDAAPYLQSYLSNENPNTYASAVETDTDASQGFYLKYADYPAASPGVYSQSSTYYASKSAKQFGDTYGQNMAAYVAVTAQVNVMDLLTKEKTLPVWSGFPFSLSAITNAETETYNLDEYNNAGALLVENENSVTGGSIVEQLNVNSFNASTKKMNAYLSKFDAGLYSMKLDGVDEYFDLGDVAAFELDTFTVSAWVKIGTAQNQTIYSNQYTTLAAQLSGFRIGIDSSNNVFYQQYYGTNSAESDTSTTDLQNDIWYHIAVSKSGTDLNIYINGLLDLNTTLTGSTIDYTSTGTQSTLIGAYRSDNSTIAQFFDGKIDDISFYSSELTAANISTIYNANSPANLASLSPLGWWRMGDSATYSGGVWTLTDAGSGGNNALSVNMEEEDRRTCIPQTVYSTKSFLFDGVDDVINIGDIPAFEIQEFSWCGWVYWETDGNQMILQSVQYRVAGGSFSGFYINVDLSGAVGGLFNTAGGLKGLLVGAALSTNEWTHVAITRNGADIKSYYNGISQTITTNDLGATAILYDSAAILTAIGYRPFGTAYEFGGYLDDIAFFDYELTPSNIQTIFNGGEPSDISALSPLGWWKMDDATFSTDWTVPDSGSGGNNGTSANMTVEDLTGIVPKNPRFSYYSMYFDGVSDYVSVPSSAEINFTDGDSFSVSVWFKVDSISGFRIIASKRDSATVKGYLIYLLNGTLRFVISADTEVPCDIGGCVIDTWYHAVLTFDGTNVLGYKDTVAGTPAATVGEFGNTSDLLFGVQDFAGTLGSYTVGFIDEISIFNKALSQIEVEELYNLGGCETPKDLTTYSAVANLVGWWQMGEGGTFGGTDWTIPDASTNSNDGTSANMSSDSVQTEVKK